MEGLVKFSPLLAIGGLVLAFFIYLSIKKDLKATRRCAI